MKRILIYLLLALSMTVFAQQQVENDEEKPVSDEQGEEQTVTEFESEDDETPQEEDEDENPEGEGEDADGDSGETGEILETDSIEDLIQDDGYLTDDQIENLTDEGDEEVIGDEVLDADDADILPEEEISEDYPVPLPSDI